MLQLTNLRDAMRHEGGLTRRLFLAYGAALGSIPLLGRESSHAAPVRFSNDPFALGVASGDPNADGMVLWTRLAPRPLEGDGGMPNVMVSVTWEVAEDDGMKRIVASGTELATPQLGHSVHVELKGLKPDRWYWYRFRCGDAESPIGRTRTLPAPDAMPDRLKFAFTSCQNYEQGLFTAYEQMAREDVDLVFHLGDYIYEYEAGRNGKVRTHLGNEIESLSEYRVRYSQYRADPLLQAMHARCPWFVTWDDHEFDNNCAADISEEQGVATADYLLRRANAYQAYYEMMPLRKSSLPSGPHLQLYRKADFGRLANLLVLDTRQYRTDQPNGDRRSPINAAALDRSSSMLGTKQRNWLYRSLLQSHGTWNVLAQQVMMGLVGFPSGDQPPVYSMDQWPGYAAERMQLMQFMADRRIANPVVLTGDIHSNWVNELRVDDRRPEQAVVATEFVGTSLTSGGNGPAKSVHADALVSNNACLKFQNNERGYVCCTVTPTNWTTDFMVIDDVLKPGGKVRKRASFVVESGDPRVNFNG